MKNRYLLLYDINEYEFGTDYKYFETLDDMDEEVNKLLDEWKDKFVIIGAYDTFNSCIEYEKSVVVTKMRRRE